MRCDEKVYALVEWDGGDPYATSNHESWWECVGCQAMLEAGSHHLDGCDVAPPCRCYNCEDQRERRVKGYVEHHSDGTRTIHK